MIVGVLVLLALAVVAAASLGCRGYPPAGCDPDDYDHSDPY